MAIIIATANQKGGVGKTITTVCLAAIFTDQGKKVLTVSLDPQRNFDMVAGEGVLIRRTDTTSLSMLHVMRGDCNIREAIVHTRIGDLLRASNQLSRWSGEQIVSSEEYLAVRDDPNKLRELMDERILGGGRNAKVLSHLLSEIRDDYDYILIDTNPSLTLLTLNALYASDYVLVPAFSEKASSEAIVELWDTIRGLNYYNSEKVIEVIGILMTGCSQRTIAYARHVATYEKLSQYMHTKLFKTTIRRSARAAEYIESGIDLIHYDPTGNTTKDYYAFAAELEASIKEREAQKHEYQA